MTGALLLLLPGAIGVHVGASDRISLREVIEVSEAVATAIEARTGQSVRIDAVDWTQCDDFDRCGDAVKARLQVDQLVLLRVFGGPLQTFVEARVEDGDAQKKASRTCPKDRVTPEAFEALAADLFPRGPPRAPPTLVATSSAAIPARDHTLPLVLGGVSVALAAVGTGLGLASRSASQDAMQFFLPPAEHDSLVSRANTEATAANIVFGAAATAAVGALVLWLAE